MVSDERMQQVSLWDGIIPKKEDAEFYIRTTNKYRFIDQVSLMQNETNNPKSIILTPPLSRDVLVLHQDAFMLSTSLAYVMYFAGKQPPW